MAGRAGSVKLVNTIRVKTKIDTNRIEIINALKKIDGFDIKTIKMIAQMRSNKKYHVKFNDNVSFDSLLGREIIIQNHPITLIDANTINLPTSMFKIMWLPDNIEHKNIIDFLTKKNIKKELIKKVEKEKMSTPGLEFIETGFIHFVLEDINKNKNHYENICGKQIIHGEECFIVKYGEGKRCIYCSQVGHIKKECVVLSSDINKICTKCNIKGHLESECSAAKVLFGNNKQIEIEEVEDDILFESSLTKTIPLSTSNITNTSINNTKSLNNNEKESKISKKPLKIVKNKTKPSTPSTPLKSNVPKKHGRVSDTSISSVNSMERKKQKGDIIVEIDSKDDKIVNFIDMI
jgi:hypothetical protein